MLLPQAFFSEDFQHIGRDVKTAMTLFRGDRHDAAGATTDDRLGLAAHAAHLVGLGVHRHNGRFPHDNAFSFHVNQGIGSTQVDPYIF